MDPKLVGQTVSVQLGNESSTYLITYVSDEGVTIQPEHIPQSQLVHTSDGWKVKGGESTPYQITFHQNKVDKPYLTPFEILFALQTRYSDLIILSYSTEVAYEGGEEEYLQFSSADQIIEFLKTTTVLEPLRNKEINISSHNNDNIFRVSIEVQDREYNLLFLNRRLEIKCTRS